jgi:sulfatase modifying factor 1
MSEPLSPRKCAIIAVASAFAILMVAPAGATDYVVIQSGALVSVLSSPSGNDPVQIEAFEMRATPVTNGEYQAFVNLHPEWQRDLVPAVFADQSYLHRWSTSTTVGDVSSEKQAVTNVSWFAAQAFCENEGARLPTWYEWEYVAAADETKADARKDPKWRARILSWYAKNSDSSPASVGGTKNYYGVRDMHGLIWEWVDDFNALFISADSRNQGDPDKLQFCGAGAISLQDKENFAILMRIALLSSLAGADTTENLGFRCARRIKKDKP